MGHNGAGKSTLISMLSGFLPPTSGDAEIYGLPLSTSRTALKGVIGVCPQQDLLFPTLTAEEHVALFGAFKYIPSAELNIPEVLKSFALEELIGSHKTVGTFSGGMKRKLSLALAFLGDPKLVLLDEPTTGVDPVSRKTIWQTIQSKKEDRCIVLTSHSMEEADILGDRICILSRGQVWRGENRKNKTKKEKRARILTRREQLRRWIDNVPEILSKF